MNCKKTAVSKRSNLPVIISVIVAGVILLNVGLNFLPDSVRRFDITTSDSYTLSNETKEYLSSLDEKVTLYVVEANGSDIKFEYFLRSLTECSDSLEVRWVGYEDVADKLSAWGVKDGQISPYTLLAETEKRSMPMGYSDLISYRTDNSTITSYIGTNEMTAAQYENIYTMLVQYMSSDSQNASSYMAMLEALLYDTDTYFNAESYICKMVEYVTVDIIPARYTLTGHGETDLSKTEIGLYISSTVGVAHNALNLAVEGEIPDDAVSIIIMKPTSDITAMEASLLTSYLNGGGQITLFTSDENLDMPNLMSVINAYGLSAEKGIVGEIVEVEVKKEASENEDTSENEDSSENEGENKETEKKYVTDVSGKVNTDHKAMAELVGLSVAPTITKGNSIVYENKSGFKLTPIITTSNKTYVGENTDDEHLDVRSLAAVSEKEGGGTLMWFTGADSFTVPILSKEEANDSALMTTVYSNCALVISSLALAPFSYESTVKLPEAKFYGERLMSVTETSFVLYAVVIVVLVVVLSVVGIILCYKRKKT